MARTLTTNIHATDTTVEDASKHISLELLKRYHHNLVSKLGLKNDSGAYIYSGDRTDYPIDVLHNVGSALDMLYDLAKEGAVEFSSGKRNAEEGETIEEVSFNTDDDSSTNLYWINAKVGDGYVNIKLDANQFTQDSVLESVVLVNMSTSTGETGDKVYKVNGKVATYTAATESEPSKLECDGKTYYGFNETADGTYMHFTWKVDKGEQGVSYNFVTISLKELYGDITGDDYISYDKEQSKISAQVADVVRENASTKSYVYPVYTEGSSDPSVITLSEVLEVFPTVVSYVPTGEGEATIVSSEPLTVLDSFVYVIGDEPYIITTKTISFDDVPRLVNLVYYEGASVVDDSVKYKYTTSSTSFDYPNYGKDLLTAAQNQLLFEFGDDLVSVEVIDVDDEEQPYSYIEYVLKCKDTVYTERSFNAGEDSVYVVSEEEIHDGETGGWIVDSEDGTNLATAENLRDVANALQESIDDVKCKSTLIDGQVTYSTTEETSLTANSSTGGQYYTLQLGVVSTEDIDGLFVECTDNEEILK